jgi:hypothetical protein
MRPMHTPPSAIESTEPQAAQGRPHTCFILPELLPTRFDALAILILAYGNRRSSPNGGYAGGARRVVAIAEHLARRPDVAVMVACILSPDNVAKRGDRFFAALYEEFLQLGADVEDHGRSSAPASAWKSPGTSDRSARGAAAPSSSRTPSRPSPT